MPSPSNLSSGFSVAEAEAALSDLAHLFLHTPGSRPRGAKADADPRPPDDLPHVDARYRALIEQIPAVVFMAYLDKGIGEAYVSPQIEAALGFSQQEWLEDPVRWYHQIHPDDKERWSVEAAQMFLSGQPLRSAYRVIARDGRVVWFHCQAAMIRREDGRPWFIHGVGVDITDLKRAEAALHEERNERKRLEHALLEISGREQRRIGQDLHDGLGQHLTGTAFMSKALQQRLAAQALPEAEDAAKIVRLVNHAIEKTRELSRGLLPVVSEDDGLMTALQRWAGEVEDLFGISCRFVCESPVLIKDVAVATHLFHIAQEAVNNAIKHGRARRILIGLGMRAGIGHLTVEDDGTGIPATLAHHQGMGLLIMSYRANMIGGALDVRRGVHCGTIVECTVPLAKGRER